jgi:hypothetical protein
MVNGASHFSPTAKVTLAWQALSFEAKREVLQGRIVSRSLAHHFPVVTFICGDVYKIKCIKNSHTPEEKRNNICREISTICREELHVFSNNVFLRMVSALGQDDDIFNIFCSTAEPSLDFLQIITATPCVAPFRESH